MGSRFAGSALLKAWSILILRLFGVPATILALYLELYPDRSLSQITHRLSRLRFRALSCKAKPKLHPQDDAPELKSDIFFVGRPKTEPKTVAGMDVVKPPPKLAPAQRRSSSLHKNKAARSLWASSSTPVSPTSPSPLPIPSPLMHSVPEAMTASTPPPPPSLPTRTPVIARKRSATLHPFSPLGAVISPTFPDLSQQHSGSSSASETPTPNSTPSHPSPRPSMPSHSRSMSHADAVKQGKRLSLQFPMQTNTPPFMTPRSRPQSWVGAHPIASPSMDPPSPTETNILAVLAAQERYVLELKEELAKAEKDLKTLKQHWSTHESMKQRNDMRKVTQLRPLDTSLANFHPDPEDEDGSTQWMQKEMERRKALLSGTKTSQRKVFSGSRHLRTLSLLSPDIKYSPSFPQPLDIQEQTQPEEEAPKRPQELVRSSTLPDIADRIANDVKDDKYDLGGLSNIQRDALLRTGKQMATDFKDGLLTFIEDIRQATVGDEGEGSGSQASARGVPTKNTRKPSEGRPALARSTGSKQSTKAADIGDDFWKAHGLSEPKDSPAQKKTHASNATRTPLKQSQKGADDFDDWNWETPNDKSSEPNSSSSDESEDSVSGRSSARTSTRYHSKRHDSKASSLTSFSSSGPLEDAALRDVKRNSIPWPDLVKLSPGNLKRTASHLMKEWEKNLTPPPEAREASHSSGDYVGRSASPSLP
ncbi:hypothetical protein P154DRAFT_525151 [Amniculicola lignicola CBS 123094]|uniref:DUF4048 domain-containing protein n=1 Tax=Amniculicola lignicola CBS 123094 TaxID=1392246 RepID=A0A6A5W525_9PLEO|nr:hypothetical protein P154DRAFT_525151 [Amniculicola lignicola CBS 123094]